MSSEQAGILLVGDAAHSAARGSALERSARELRRAETIAEALGIVAAWRPLVAVVATPLPDGSALDFCRQARAAGNPRLSIVVVAEAGEKRALAAALAAGASELVTLPLDAPAAEEKLHRILNAPTRHAVRAIVKLTIEARTSDRTFVGTALNLSASGMLLKSERPLAVGETAELRFFVPRHPAPFVARARVVRLVAAEHTTNYGIEFVGLAPGDAERLSTYVDSL